MSTTTFKCKVCGNLRENVTPFSDGLLKCCRRFLFRFDHNHVFDKNYKYVGHIKYAMFAGKYYPVLLLSDLEHREEWNKPISSIDDYEEALDVFVKLYKEKEKIK